MRYTLFVAMFAVIIACDNESNDPQTPVRPGPFLKSVTWYQEIDAEFIPGDRTEYTYADGFLIGAKHYYFDEQLDEYVLRSKETFTYNDGRLISVTQFTVGS